METLKMLAPAMLNGKNVKNRIIRSATNDHLGNPDGTVSDAEIEMYETLASNNIGTIITGHLSVSPNLNLRADEMQLSIGDDRFIDGLTRIPTIIHKYDALAIAQISLAGPSGMNPFDFNTLTTEQMQLIRDWFIEAAVRAQKAGFDGVQLHCAHFYFMQAILCTDMNHRTDQYGGSPENCVRFVKEIAEGIRAGCGEKFILMAKLNAHNTLSENNDFALLHFYCAQLFEVGANLFEISGRDFINQPKEASLYYIDAVAYLKEKSPDFVVSIVGGIYGVDGIEEALKIADFVSMSRALLTQPELITMIVKDHIQRSRCIRCNQCFKIFSTKYKRCIFGPVIPQLQKNFELL